MFHLIQLQQLEDYFLPGDQREQNGAYFYRIVEFSAEIDKFLIRYFQEARKCGVVQEGKIANPTEQNLAYYREMLGTAFELRPAFFQQQLAKWLPRLEPSQQKDVAEAIYDVLKELARSGKNENMLKNAYIKFMCWMYYRFERILHLLGKKQFPKILYEGSITFYELKLLRILFLAGCDILLVDVQGDGAYKKLDGASCYSYCYCCSDGKPFPANYTIRKQAEQAKLLQQAVGVPVAARTQPTVLQPCINAWISGDIFADVQKPAALRGDDRRFYYTLFARICGVEDKASYLNTLLQLYLNLSGAERRVVVLEQQIGLPTPDEIAQIRRKNYQDRTDMLLDLAQNIVCTVSDLQRLLRQQFISFLQETLQSDGRINRQLNQAVYLLCWLRRYQNQLFGQWQQGDMGVLLFLSPCRNETEQLFLRFLARLPVDVVIFSPNLNLNAKIEDKYLYEKKYTIAMDVLHYPTEGTVQLGTVAYHAEQELTETLYQDSGLYREQQYQKARAVALKTMYEEIYILWQQEESYRPNFQIVQDEVLMPVIFAKVSGVKDGNVQNYWNDVQKLLVKDSFFIRQAPFVESTAPNDFKQYAADFFRKGLMQKQKLKGHKVYPYSYLREEMQDYMLDKLQQLIDLKLIRGTFQNGTEYTIVATVLNLEKNIVRLIQKMDFTKLAPKLVLVNTGETVYSLEDSIIAAYLHLLGFDIVLFAPTGYRSLEQYYTQPVLTEHIIGEYVYDLKIPAKLAGDDGKRNRGSLRDLLLGRGR